tara:strand:+ start:1091 stop:2074 length:984 start_codon:yes stop_codon:yes gene_type:complete
MAEENKVEEILSETDESSVEVTDKIEAQFDEFLTAIDADEDEVGVKAEEVAQPEEVAAPEPEAKEDTSSDQEEAREEPEVTEETPELEKALAALKRDGLPTALIEKMSNEEVLEYGEKRSKVQGDTDEAYRKLSELKKVQETAPENSEKSEVPAEPVDQPSPVNLQEAVKPFADLFGDDAAEALQQVTAAAIQPYVQQINMQQNVLEGFLMKEAKAELTDQYPSLDTDDGYERVSERMKVLVKSGEYTEIRDLMSDASRLVFADGDGPHGTNYQSKLAKSKASGQPTASGRSTVGGPPMTEEERDDAILEMIESGQSPADIQRVLGR